jgi:alpha-mannosidase
VGKHQGALPPEHSFLQVGSDNVIVSALKKAEDQSALVVRFYEWAGKQAEVKVQLAPGAESARETDLMEKPMGGLQVNGSAVNVPIKPYEIKTVEVQFSDVGHAAVERP